MAHRAMLGFMEYTTIWVEQWVDARKATVHCADVDRVVNEHAQAGWTLHSIVPGTNAQTYGGLFLTFER